MHVNRTSGLESNVGQKVKTLVTLYVPSKARRLLGQRWEASLVPRPYTSRVRVWDFGSLAHVPSGM